MNPLLAAALVLLVAVAAAFAFAPRAAIVTTVQIDATPAQVWKVLADPAGYEEWNPFLVKMEGRLEEGSRLTNTMRPSGGRTTTFRPVVLAATPGKELRWLGRLFVPRLFDGEHYFLLEERDGGTWLTQGEEFRGIGLWLIDVEQFRPDFEALDAALKARVEARVEG